MKKKHSSVLISSLLFLAPTLALAVGTIDSLLTDTTTLASMLQIAGTGVSLVAFFWGLALFIWNEGNAEKKEEGKSIMTWGVLAMFVLVTIWGIIGFMQATFGNTEGPGVIHIDRPVLP